MPTSDTPANAALPGKFATEWPDGTGRAWHVEADSERIVLASGDDVLDVPRAIWSRDIYVAAHAGGYIIRFETFDHSVGFLMSSERATPLLAILGAHDVREEKIEDEEEPHPGTESPAQSRTELLWPKVSPLAVGALLCAAPSFVPLFGWPFAIASIVLLVLHRRRVRHSAAWRHSRALCLAALCFLVVGLFVSLLAIGTIVRQTTDEMILGQANEFPIELRADAPSQTEPQRSEAIVRAGFFDEQHNWGLIAAALVVVLLSLTVHEGAHAISAWWLGDDFAKRLGRVTLNPLAHIDPFGTVVLPLILFVSGMGVFGWAKPVPVRTEVLPNPRRAHIWIALAGPASNLLLAAASLTLLIGMGCIVGIIAPQGTIENLSGYAYDEAVKASGFALAPVVGAACTVLKLSFFINTFLAFFNLIPIPPLDGSWVLEHSFPRTIGPIYARLRPYAFMIFLGLIYSGILRYLLLPAIAALFVGLETVAWCTPF